MGNSVLQQALGALVIGFLLQWEWEVCGAVRIMATSTSAQAAQVQPDASTYHSGSAEEASEDAVVDSEARYSLCYNRRNINIA